MVGSDPPPGSTAADRPVIRIERVTMPKGLRAIADRDPRGDLIIYVSAAVDADRAQAAVREVIRASRRAGWRTELPPAGVALLVALQQLLRRGARALRAQRAAWATAAAALVAGGSAAAVFLMPAPHQHISSALAQPPVRRAALPYQPRSVPARHRGQAQPVAARPSRSSVSPAGPEPARTATPPTRPSRSPSPAPSSPPPPSPSPTPTPSPSAGNPGGCVPVLVIRVCLPRILP